MILKGIPDSLNKFFISFDNLLLEISIICTISTNSFKISGLKYKIISLLNYYN